VEEWVRTAISNPTVVTDDVVLEIIRDGEARGRKLWTPSRVLKRLGVAPWPAQHRPLLLRVQSMMRDLEATGLLVRRPEQQTSRNNREEVAYELASNRC
jgi:hypothetical protein